MENLKRSREAAPPTIELSSAEELAVHPNKIKEVTNQLSLFKSTGKGFILVLSGPHGSGKTTTLKLIAKKLNLKLQMWSPKDLEEEDRSISYVDQLIDYLLTTSRLKKAIRIPGCYKKELPSILLIDTLPGLFNDAQKDLFKSTLERLSQSLDKLICFVLSDMSKKSIDRIFGKQYSLIEFNRIAKKFMESAIRRAIYLLNTELSVSSVELAAHGNLHKAMNLILINQGINKKCFESADDDYEFQFFHTLGKFLYNKRIDALGKIRAMRAEELVGVNKPRLYFDPDDIINRAPCDPNVIWQYLEENFLDFYGDIKDALNAIEQFEVADCLDSAKYKDSRALSEYLPSYLAGRAVLGYNNHPKFGKFFQLSKPTHFTAKDKYKESKYKILNYFKDGNCMNWEMHVIEIYGFLNSNITRVIQEEADDDFLCNNLTLSLDNISV